MKNLILEAHRRSLWQVLGIYLVGAWIALQVVDVLANNFGLPEWFPAFALALLVLGLPIVLATAFVQEGVAPLAAPPTEDEAASQSAAPTPGAQNVLTWRNAVWGGVAASAVWGLVALGWFALGTRGEATGPGSASGHQSIAVLPFTARSATDNSETDFFAEGMHDDLLTQLSKIEALTVISRTSVMQFRDTEMEIPAIAEQLGVETVLEGAVDHAGDRLRVNVQLIEADTDRHLWAETYDEEFTAANVFAIRADLARKIADALEATLTPELVAQLETRPTESLEAYDLYSRGQYVLSQRGHTKVGIEDAIALLQEATATDADYAPAHAALADALWNYWNQGYIAEAEVLPQIRSATDRALTLDPQLAEAHIADALVRRMELDEEGNGAAIQRALELNPGSARAHSLYSNWLLGRGEPDRAVEEARRAVELDPLDVGTRRSLVSRLAWAGRSDETIAEADKLLELDPNQADAFYYVGLVHQLGGDLDDALVAYRTAAEMNPVDPYYPAAVALVYAEQGNREEAESYVMQALEAGVPLKEPAIVYALLGDLDVAFDYLVRAAESEPGTLSGLASDPSAEALRADPRYDEIMRRISGN
jgi:TolB-like protein/Flp pilus assembly protein TadD